jgi:Holliday junction resolvasome RuvABC DNA-binding subunit
MTQRRKKRYSPKNEYVEKAKALTKKEAERLMARMRKKFTRRLEDKKFSALEALAMQLEFEDEQLGEWRKSLAEIRKKKHKE